MRTQHQIMSGATTKDLHLISVFNLSDEELTERLRPTYETMKLKKFAKGGYITYYDPSVCPTSTHIVHEYADRKQLMLVDHNGKEHFVKNL
jgi:hypothetical protein